jgi:hypothetical protein
MRWWDTQAVVRAFLYEQGDLSYPHLGILPRLRGAALSPLAAARGTR